MIDALGMLLKYSSLCTSADVGSLESLYRRRSTKPLVMEVQESYNPEHLKMIPEDPSDIGREDMDNRIPLPVIKQESCPEFVLQLQEKTGKIRKIQSMGSWVKKFCVCGFAEHLKVDTEPEIKESPKRLYYHNKTCNLTPCS